MSSQANETFICLYCQQWLVGDDAWLDHLRSTSHGVAKQYDDYQHMHAATLPEPLE